MIRPDIHGPAGSVRCSRTADGVRVVLAGEVDLSCSDLLADASAALADAMPSDVQLDVTDVTFLASEGLGFLAATSRLVVDQHRRSLTLHNPGPTLQRTAKLCGILDRLTVTRDQA
jgi:anti-anti-sigma factor